jgi:sugar lactone lactonase YvrE
MPVAAPAMPPPQSAAAPAAPTAIVIKDAGLQTPECALWDADQDVYFISNINGDPTAIDQNGFISKIGPDGKVVELKFIDGTKKGGELNAPKGLAIAGKILYVADLDTVRMFDRKSGKPKGKIAIKDAVFLNALTVSPDGKVLYVSDSAVKIKDGNFSGTGSDAIFEIDLRKRSVKPLVQDKALRWPNGVLADASGVWVVTLGANELIHVSYKGELGAVTKLPRGGLDGIVKLADGSLLISSWEASAVYRGLPGGEFKEIISGVPSPAAIGLDSKRRAVLIPVFTASTFEVHTLPVLPVLEAPTPPPPAPAAKPAIAPVAVPAQAPAAQPARPAAPPPAAPAPASAPAAPPAHAPAPVYAPAPVPAYAPAPAPAPAPAATPAPAAAPAPSGTRPTRWP